VPSRPVERACARLAGGGPLGGLTPPHTPPAGRATAAARPQRGLPTPGWTRLPPSRLPLGVGGLGVAPVGVWGGLGGTNPFSRRISTLSRKLTNQPPRADTQSKINAAS
jgi:hypothetical protein